MCKKASGNTNTFLNLGSARVHSYFQYLYLSRQVTRQISSQGARKYTPPWCDHPKDTHAGMGEESGLLGEPTSYFQQGFAPAYNKKQGRGSVTKRPIYERPFTIKPQETVLIRHGMSSEVPDSQKEKETGKGKFSLQKGRENGMSEKTKKEQFARKVKCTHIHLTHRHIHSMCMHFRTFYVVSKRALTCNMINASSK